METGGTVPRSRRRADCDSYPDSFVHSHAITHPNSQPNRHAISYAHGNANTFSYQNSDTFYTNIFYYYSIVRPRRTDWRFSAVQSKRS